MRTYLKKIILALPAVDSALPKNGLIADLGCGEGIASSYLAQKKSRELIGIDLNSQKIHLAQARSQSNLKFKTGNIVTAQFPQKLSGVLIADVLHHLTPRNQQFLLQNVTKHLKKGGKLVIKEIDKDDIFRSTLSRLWDFIFYPQDKIYYYSKSQLIATLQKLKYKVMHQKVDKFIPASINIYIATKT